MVAEMSYSTVSNVIDTWEMVRRRENYEQEVGTKLFQRCVWYRCIAILLLLLSLLTLFRIPFQLQILHHWTRSQGNLWFQGRHGPNFRRSDQEPTLHQARAVLCSNDRSRPRLAGPEIELLTEIMLDLGEKHVRYGVRAEFFPAMGTALIHAVSQVLGEDNFTDEIRADWLEVYGALSYDMIRGQKQAH